MKTIIRNFAAGLLLALAIPASAQELASTYFMETGNFSHQLNPALLKEGNFSFLLGNFNIGAGLNTGAESFIYKNPGANANDYPYTTFMNPNISASQFMNNLPDHTRINIGLNMNLVSVAFKGFKGVNLIEVNLRSQTAAALPKELFGFMKNFGSKDTYSFSDLGFRSQSYAELALGHSHKIGKKWTVGAKVKFLLGLAYTNFEANNFKLTMNGDQWRITGDANLQASCGEMTLLTKDPVNGGSHPAVNGEEFDDFDEMTPGLSGFGMAFDFGATYEPIKHLKVSAAITDLGYISWSKTEQLSTTKLNEEGWTFDGFSDIYVASNKNNKDLGDHFDAMGEDLEEVFKLQYAGQGKHRKALAATMNLGVEYKLPQYDKLKFGFLYSGRMSKVYKYHQSVLSVGIRPVKCFEFLANISGTTYGWTGGGILSLHAKHFNLHLGAQAPLSGKFSKDMVPLNAMNAHFNLGMTFPL